MPPWQRGLVGLAAALVLYLAAVLALVRAGRRTDARALAGFVPDCVVLLQRLLGDPRVPRSRKALLGVLVLRAVLRGSGEALLREHWPGPQESLEVIRQIAFRR